MDYYIEKAKKIGRRLVKHYQKHGADIKIVGCQIVRSLYRCIYTIEISPGTKVQTIFERASDIQFALGLHLVFPFKEGVSIRIAVSEYEVKENRLLKALTNPIFSKSDYKIPLALGYDIIGKIHIADMSKLYHLLVIGPSGTGKSTALQSIVMSILVKCSASSVKLLLFDIGANSLSLFSDVLHLYHPIIKDIETTVVVLESLVAEMEERINRGENECLNLPYIVCVIDEFDDAIASYDDNAKAKRLVASLNSIIRRGRKAKIILILASHDPTLKNTKVNVSLIVPRIVFQCGKTHNSLTAGVTGADKLPAGGAMLFKSQTGTKFLQGSFVTPEEIERVLGNAPEGDFRSDMLKIREPEMVYLSEPNDSSLDNHALVEKTNQELADITYWALQRKTVSSRKIQERFRMSKRADGIVDKLLEMKIVDEQFSNQPRKVLPTCIDDLLPETIAFMERYGYKTEDVIEAFSSKNEL